MSGPTRIVVEVRPYLSGVIIQLSCCGHSRFLGSETPRTQILLGTERECLDWPCWKPEREMSR